MLSVVLVMQVARLRLDWRAEVAGLEVAGGVWMLADRAAGIGKVEQLYAGAGGSVAFIFSCLMGGRLLSRILRERNILLPVAGVAILADIFTVFVGPAGKALAKAPQLVQKFSVGLPTAGAAVPGAHLPPTVGTMGLGDFIFLALFLTAAARFGFPLRRARRVVGDQDVARNTACGDRREGDRDGATCPGSQRRAAVAGLIEQAHQWGTRGRDAGDG